MSFNDEEFEFQEASASPEKPKQETPQETPKQANSSKATLSSLFALLSSIAFGFAAAFSIQRIFWFYMTFLPFIIIAALIGVAFLVLSIVFGAKAKKEDPSAHASLASSKGLSMVFGILAAVALSVFFLFLMFSHSVGDWLVSEYLFGLNHVGWGRMAGFASYAAFPLLLLWLGYKIIYDCFSGKKSLFGSRRGLALSALFASVFIGAFFFLQLLLFFQPSMGYTGCFPEWRGEVVFTQAGGYDHFEYARDQKAFFDVWGIWVVLMIFAIATTTLFLIHLVLFLIAKKKGKAHGSFLFYGKKVLSIILILFGIGLFVAAFVLYNMSPAYPPTEYIVLGHTYGGLTGTLLWIAFPIFSYSVLGVLPFFVASFFVKKGAQATSSIPEAKPQEKEQIEESNPENKKEKRPSKQSSKGEKEELDDVLQEKLSLQKAKYRTVSGFFGASLLLAFASLFAFIGIITMRFGYGYTDKIYGALFIILLLTSILFVALAIVFGIFLRKRIHEGIERDKVKAFSHKKLLYALYWLTLLPFAGFVLLFAIDVTDLWTIGIEARNPSYYAGFFLILWLAVLGLAIAYGLARAWINQESLAKRRGTFALSSFFNALFVYTAISMFLTMGFGGSYFASYMPRNIGEAYVLFFLIGIAGLVAGILELALYLNAKKKGEARGKFLIFSRSALPVVFLSIIGVGLLVVGIILVIVATGSTKTSAGAGGLGFTLLWPGMALVFTNFFCVLPLTIAGRKLPPDPVEVPETPKDENEEKKDEYGFVIGASNVSTEATEGSAEAVDKNTISSSGLSVESPLEFARSLSRYFRSHGLALEEKEAVRLLAFLSYSHLLYIKGMKNEEAKRFLEILSSFFESEFTSYEEKVDLPTYFQECFDLNKRQPTKPCFLAQIGLGSDAFSDELNPILPPLNDLSMPYVIKELNQRTALPPNLYHFVFLKDGDTGLAGKEEAFSMASMFSLTIPSCAEEGEAEPMPLTDHDFLSLVGKATDRFYMSEDNWKKLDALSGFVSSMKDYILTNDARNGIERATAFMLSSMFDEEYVFDEILASCVLPAILLHLDDAELIEGEKGLHAQTGIIFGDTPLRKANALFQDYQAELLRRKEAEMAPAEEASEPSEEALEPASEEIEQTNEEETPVEEEAPLDEETPSEQEEPILEDEAPAEEEAPLKEEPLPQTEEPILEENKPEEEAPVLEEASEEEQSEEEPETEASEEEGGEQ